MSGRHITRDLWFCCICGDGPWPPVHERCPNCDRHRPQCQGRDEGLHTNHHYLKATEKPAAIGLIWKWTLGTVAISALVTSALVLRLYNSRLALYDANATELSTFGSDPHFHFVLSVNRHSGPFLSTQAWNYAGSSLTETRTSAFEDVREHCADKLNDAPSANSTSETTPEVRVSRTPTKAIWYDQDTLQLYVWRGTVSHHHCVEPIHNEVLTSPTSESTSLSPTAWSFIGGASASTFIATATGVFYFHKYDPIQKYFLFGGITIGIVAGLGAGADLRTIILAILPWTVAFSFAFNSLVRMQLREHFAAERLEDPSEIFKRSDVQPKHDGKNPFDNKMSTDDNEKPMSSAQGGK